MRLGGYSRALVTTFPALLPTFHGLFFNEIIFCITNEISFTIISLSSSDKFILESGFFIRNYYYITNYLRNLPGCLTNPRFLLQLLCPYPMIHEFFDFLFLFLFQHLLTLLLLEISSLFHLVSTSLVQESYL